MSKYITVVLAVTYIMLPGAVLDHYGEKTSGTACAEDGQARPKVKFLKKKFNFGSIKKGKVISHDFTLMNEGNTVLKIVDQIPA